MLKVICINAENKPKRVSPYEWIKEGEIYTVIEISKMGLQAGRFGYKLKEIQLSEQSFPYEYYNSDRFVPVISLQQVLREEQPEELVADLDLV
jgi:hypothetical protein